MIGDMVAFVRTLSPDKTAVAAGTTVAKSSDESAVEEEDEGTNIVRWIILGIATAFFVGIAV